MKSFNLQLKSSDELKERNKSRMELVNNRKHSIVKQTHRVGIDLIPAQIK